jgi:hypothetical protein
MQKKAVAEMSGIEIGGCEIAVNIAVDKPDEDRLIKGKCYSCGKMDRMAKSCKGGQKLQSYRKDTRQDINDPKHVALHYR